MITIEEGEIEKDMWRKGTIKLSDMTVCEFCVKYYNEASEDYGINGGKISKLMIKIDDEIVASYDRGWDFSALDFQLDMANFNYCPHCGAKMDEEEENDG